MLSAAVRAEIAALLVACMTGCSAPPKAQDCEAWADIEAETPEHRAGDPNAASAAKRRRYWGGIRCPFT